MIGVRVAALVLLAGCSTIDQHTEPPADWPDLMPIEHRVSPGEVLTRCYRYVSWPLRLLGSVPFGCAELNFTDHTCTVWYPDDAAGEHVRRHELLHCAGYDHPGESTLRDAWRAYVAGQVGRAAASAAARP